MAAISEEELATEFGVFGVEVDDLMIIEKFKEISLIYKLNAASIVEEWVAFSAAGFELNLKSLEEFKTKLSSDKRHKSQSMKSETKNMKLYNKENIDELIMEQEINMLEMYRTPEQKKSIKRLRTTPESVNKMLHTLTGRTPSFSPASLPTPVSATPAKRYEARENAGEVVLTYNPSGMSDKNITWKQQQIVNVRNAHDKPLTEKFKYMFQKMLDKSQVLNERINKMASLLKDAHKIEEYASAGVIHQDDVSVIGRICCDTNGKLNASSLILRESGTNHSGTSVSLNVADVNEYSLFPGKVVAIKGINPTGEQFMASSFYEGVLPPVLQHQETIQTDTLSVFVAVGPFTTSESDSYEPLTDFLNQVLQEQPNLVIMMGPFVDAKNDLIDKCEISKTFQELFASKVNEIGICAKRVSTKFVLIPSQRDVHHNCVYPQPPFCPRDIKNTLNKYKNKNQKGQQIQDERNGVEKNISSLQFFSDPCTLEVNGFTLGMTSTDVLFHMGGEEIAFPPGSGDKMGRLVKNILTQQCYYPLFPPSEDVCVDYEVFAEHARLPCKPDVFIVPSDLRYFVKNVMGCLSINPGRLTKGLVGGTFTRLLLRKNQSTQDVVDASLVQIVKI